MRAGAEYGDANGDAKKGAERDEVGFLWAQPGDTGKNMLEGMHENN